MLFEIINPDDIHLALDVFENDVNKLHIGQKLLAYTNNDPDKKYPCEIILIGKDFHQTDQSKCIVIFSITTNRLFQALS